MIKIEQTDVYGWEAAIRGMRSPMNSWDMSDSDWEFVEEPNIINPHDEVKFIAGAKDLDLMQRLSKAGSDHGKFLRYIDVTCDITAPLYWWKEYDTYKVGTVANSCSTMHKIHAKEFDLDDFSHEHLMEYSDCYKDKILWVAPLEVLASTIETLNTFRRVYIKTKDKKYWWQMIQLLPSSYNQKRTVKLNYQVLKSMYHARRNHKLDEWKDFCRWCEGLPYFKEICVEPMEKEDDKCIG